VDNSLANEWPKMIAGPKALVEAAVSSIVGGLLALPSAVLAGPTTPSDLFSLSSPAFADNGYLARKFAGEDKSNPYCVGENISPPLAWSNPPKGTNSYALILFDPQGHAGLGTVHWVAYDIPTSVTGFAEGEVSKPSEKYVGGKNSFDRDTYSGPCTGPGDWHHYTFTLIATDLDPKALRPGMTRDELLTALRGHALLAAGLIGRFRHD
jgi:Raf kinase inhibitor-like YbhB/YbcL family protein